MITNMMNETRRNPTTRTRCPSPFYSISGTGSFICPVAQTQLDIPRALITQSWATIGERSIFGKLDPPTCRSTVEHANHQTTMTAPKRRISYTPGPQRGDLIPNWSVVCDNSPATCRASPGGPETKIVDDGAEDLRTETTQADTLL